MGQVVAPAPFSEKQQRQSRYDGGLEEDGETQRPLVPVVQEEPLVHIARERRRADYNHQMRRNEYKEVPLTGNQLSARPRYQQVSNFS